MTDEQVEKAINLLYDYVISLEKRKPKGRC